MIELSSVFSLQINDMIKRVCQMLSYSGNKKYVENMFYGFWAGFGKIVTREL